MSNSNDILQKIEFIQSRFDELIIENSFLKSQQINLENEKKNLENEIIVQQEIIKSLENKIKILKIAGNSEEKSEDEIKALKMKMNAIIREVDKCLMYFKN